MLIVIIAAGALFMTGLGVARTLDKNIGFYERFKSSMVSDDSEKNDSVLTSTYELSTSIRSFYAVVDFVPESHPYTTGRFMLQHIVDVVPFSSKISSSLFGDDHYRFTSPSAFATWIIQGENPKYGNGITCIADFYLEFGVLGIVLGMFSLGFFLRCFEVAYYNVHLPPLLLHIFSLVYLSDAIYLSRSSVLLGLRQVVWIYVILFVNKVFYRQKRKVAG